MAADTDSRVILIQGPRIVDPGRGMDIVGDILIGDGKIVSAGPRLSAEEIPEDCRVIPAVGLVAAPGFIDLHCHLREPGFEYKETIATGTRAAARGGFTSICCMPNTNPPIDNEAMVELVKQRARTEGVVRVFPIGCVTKGRRGKELAEMEELAAAGVVAYSDDGDPVYDPNIMRLALTYTLDLGMPVSNHCQEHSLCPGGVMAEGWVATRLGLAGIPAAAEEAMIARDLALAELTGGWLHLAHLSTAGSVALVRQARERGVSVTTEVCPHHLSITDEWALGNRGISGLAEGVIDCIATDHAPHELASKQVTYQDAAFGISVFETALGSLMGLVHRGQISLSTMVDRLTVGPARVLGPAFEELATLYAGTPADLVIFDPSLEWIVDTREFASKGKNTPLEGTTLKGRVVTTLVDGKPVFEELVY